jgi:precorrin-2/cobalt-factor-2 C20-methyltransferase
MTDFSLTGVGVGPGDPELITIKALKRLQQADIVFAMRNKKTGAAVALDIARVHLSDEQQVMPLDIERGRRAGERTAVWKDVADDIADVMRRYATDHDAEQVRAVLVQLGDPSLFGTFDYAAVPLRERHPDIALDVLAGVNAFSELAARLGLPLSGVDERVCILPTTYEDDDALRQALTDYDAVILLKMGFVRARVLNLLDDMGLMQYAVYAERLGLDDERVVTNVAELDRQAKGPYLSMMLVVKNRDTSLL